MVHNFSMAAKKGGCTFSSLPAYSKMVSRDSAYNAKTPSRKNLQKKNKGKPLFSSFPHRISLTTTSSPHPRNAKGTPVQPKEILPNAFVVVLLFGHLQDHAAAASAAFFACVIRPYRAFATRLAGALCFVFPICRIDSTHQHTIPSCSHASRQRCRWH